MTTIQYGDHEGHAWYYELAEMLLASTPIHTREWQSRDTSASPQHATRELVDIAFGTQVHHDVDSWTTYCHPDLPWAEEHFMERVGGEPLNPPPSHVRWPYARFDANAAHMDASGAKFSHTYPERLWPRFTGEVTITADRSVGFWENHRIQKDSDRTQVVHVHPVTGQDTVVWDGATDGDGLNEWLINHGFATRTERRGIRERYGDLYDVLDLLARSPFTRQAYIPIWFPEDTGNVGRVRVPCTLGYHVMIRNGQLHCWYAMRSCDLVRHMRNDIYMAGRLMQWLCTGLNEVDEFRRILPEGVQPGRLNMTISSLHAFVGDDWKLKKLARGDES